MGWFVVVIFVVIGLIMGDSLLGMFLFLTGLGLAIGLIIHIATFVSSRWNKTKDK